MSSNSIIRAGRVAAVLALLVPAGALAQTADGAASEGMPATTDTSATAPATPPVGGDAATAGTGTANERVNPHLLLDDLSGGPQGSPTAQRGNPQPGTSTSIPTTNPATVRPLQQFGAGNENVAVEDTGIEGQCDPVVSLGCPSIADRLQSGTAAAGATDAAATPAEAGAVNVPSETPAEAAGLDGATETSTEPEASGVPAETPAEADAGTPAEADVTDAPTGAAN